MFPLLKSSDLANDRLRPTRFVLLTQRRVGDSTEEIEWTAPKTWHYLLDHARQLDTRGSSIYRDRARFSIFGVGDYSSHLRRSPFQGYTRIALRALGVLRQANHGRRHMLLHSLRFYAEAQFFAELLNSERRGDSFQLLCSRMRSDLLLSTSKANRPSEASGIHGTGRDGHRIPLLPARFSPANNAFWSSKAERNIEPRNPPYPVRRADAPHRSGDFTR